MSPEIEEVKKIEKNRNVEVNIYGLALSHFDQTNKQWRLFFPKAPKHSFKVKVRKFDISGPGEPKPLMNEVSIAFSSSDLPPTLKLQVKGKRTDIIQASYEKEHVAKIIDFSEIHAEEDQPKEIHVSDDLRNYQGFLTIKNSTLFTLNGSGETKYDLWKAEPYSNPSKKEAMKPREREIGKTGRFSFHLQAEDILEFLMSSFDQTSLIPLMNINAPTENILYQISFENECWIVDGEQECEDADFKYYYNIIDANASNLKERYDLIPIPPMDDDGKGKTGSCDKSIASSLEIPQSILAHIDSN